MGCCLPRWVGVITPPSKSWSGKVSPLCASIDAPWGLRRMPSSPTTWARGRGVPGDEAPHRAGARKDRDRAWDPRGYDN